VQENRFAGFRSESERCFAVPFVEVGGDEVDESRLKVVELPTRVVEVANVVGDRPVAWSGVALVQCVEE